MDNMDEITTLMSKNGMYKDGISKSYNYDNFRSELNAVILEEVLKIVGEDDTYRVPDGGGSADADNFVKAQRNQLRSEQRTALQNKYGKEDE